MQSPVHKLWQPNRTNFDFPKRQKNQKLSHNTCTIWNLVDAIIKRKVPNVILTNLVSIKITCLFCQSARLSGNSWILLASSVEPSNNEGPRDQPIFFALTRFRYIKVPFHIFYYYWGKENRHIIACIARFNVQKTATFAQSFMVELVSMFFFCKQNVKKQDWL